MAGSQYYSTFDSSLRIFSQLRMSERDADKTSFAVRTGTYCFRRMPFGLCNAGSTFMRVMQSIMHGMNLRACLVYSWRHYCLFSPRLRNTSPASRNFSSICARLSCVLSLANVSLCTRRYNLLGHHVNHEGIATDPAKNRRRLPLGPPCAAQPKSAPS